MLCISVFYNRQRFDAERPAKITDEFHLAPVYLHSVSERPRQLLGYDVCLRPSDNDWRVLFRPAQTTMPSRPLKKEIRTRKFLKGASIYKQVYAKKADIVSIGEYAEVRQANHTATETHETSGNASRVKSKRTFFDESVFRRAGDNIKRSSNDFLVTCCL